jgi:hypothetical protein
LRQQRADFVLKQKQKKMDIMLLLTLASAESFAIVANNKNTCAERGWHPLNYALTKHTGLQEGARTEVECNLSHATMLAFNYGCALVDPASLNMQERFSETIVNRMVNAALQKRQEAGADLTLLAEKRRATALKRITDIKTLHDGAWVLGYDHHLGPEAVEISKRNSKLRKDEELGKRKRVHEKTKKFDDDVKRVLNESSPEEWASQE